MHVEGRKVLATEAYDVDVLSRGGWRWHDTNFPMYGAISHALLFLFCMKKNYSIKLNSKNKINWKSYSWMKSLSKNEITPWRQKTLNSLDPYATHLLALETIYRTLTAQVV